MHFVHKIHQANDTIAALATPPGVGGIAIIRLSGEKAIEIASQLCKKNISKQTTHTARLRSLFDHHNTVNILDTALVLLMKAPKSFTGEDTVEFHCHGGHLIAKKVVESLAWYGARPAEPGEFSLRAFCNGKIDLAQAEAIQNLIGAKNEKALQVAESHLEGRLSKKIQEFQKIGTHVAAIFEAWVDFPEEDLEFSSLDTVLVDLIQMRHDVERLIKTYQEGKIIHEGISLCFIGSPNVGKSSLMNILLGKERAIVSAVAGTTRDTVEDEVYINGLNLRLIDTAGIRVAQESIEEEGIRRSKLALDRSDVALIILDASRPHDQEMLDIVLTVAQEKSVVVWNKVDIVEDLSLLPVISHPRVVFISAQTGEGIENLKKSIENILWSYDVFSSNEVMITSVRHRHALESSLDCLDTVIFGLQAKESPEFLVFDMKQFLQHLGSVIGTDITEDILTAIFSQFCIGK